MRFIRDVWTVTRKDLLIETRTREIVLTTHDTAAIEGLTDAAVSLVDGRLAA